MALLINIIIWVSRILIWLLIARAISSWFARSGGTGYMIYLTLSRWTEPIVAPCRKLTRRFNTGILDISVLLAFLLIMVTRDALIWILRLFM